MLTLWPIIAPAAGALFIGDLAFAKKKVVEGVLRDKIYQLGVRIFSPVSGETEDAPFRETKDLYTVVVVLKDREKRILCDKNVWIDLKAGQKVKVSTTVGFFTKIVYDYEIIK
jgi:hypothetical protein